MIRDVLGADNSIQVRVTSEETPFYGTTIYTS